MSWYDTIETEIDSYYSGNKNGLFGKKNTVKLVVYPTRIEVIAFPIYEGLIQKESETYYFDYSEIKDIYAGTIDNKAGIIIEYIPNSIVKIEETKKVIVLEIPEMDKWVNLIKKTKDELIEKNKKAEKEKTEKEIQAKLLSEKKENDALKFYTDCYKFHISEDTPCYELFREKNRLAVIYVGEDKSLNFLKIDGYNQEESNGVVLYEKIHYYEKAGNIHYVTDIHGSYLNYGGSVTGGKFSKLATVGGGLLFGMMGMTAGALLTYKPAEVEGATTQFKIDSDARKIDERSVILNFYSDLKKQYIDIELPADIYNFLQTYLPKKKYNIVLEVEKRAAIYESSNLIENREVLKSVPDNSSKESGDQMEAFKSKVEKLKMMRDADLLTEDEFKEEKAKLLDML